MFTALTDTRFYGLNYNIPSLCFGASGAAMHGFNEYVDLESLAEIDQGHRAVHRGMVRGGGDIGIAVGSAYRPQRRDNRIQSVGERRRTGLQDQRRFDLDDAVVADRRNLVQPGRFLILSGTTFLPHHDARMTSGAAARTTSGKMIRSLAAC